MLIKLFYFVAKHNTWMYVLNDHPLTISNCYKIEATIKFGE